MLTMACTFNVQACTLSVHGCSGTSNLFCTSEIEEGLFGAKMDSSNVSYFYNFEYILI